MLRPLAASLLLLLPLPLAAQNPVKPRALEAHVRFLADDLLEGRETGSRGHAVAARYVAAQFAAAGLQPAGDDGSWFQRVPLRASKLVPNESSFAVVSGGEVVTFAHRKDVLILPGLGELADVDAPVVFAGYGIVAPELHRDDYAGVDVKGKIVLVLRGAPQSFAANPRAYYSSSAVKNRFAADRGAIGVLAVKGPADEQRLPFATEVARPESVPMLYAGEPQESRLRVRVNVGRNVAEALFAGGTAKLDATMQELESGAVRSFPLATRLRAHVVTTFSDVVSENVVARLEGTDAKLRDEHVVFTAHVDHLGTDPTRRDDPIYNGALDNGSGVACLLEIAKAAAARPRPRRSMLFVALTGEEKGEQGATAFVDLTKRRLVADINMDMFMMLFPVQDVVLLGADQTTLGAVAATAAADAGFTLSRDPQPEEVRFIRSDQYAFVKKGIPAIHLKAGLHSRDPKIDGAALSREWLRNVYHSPRDEASQTIDYASGARYAYANLLLGTRVANAKSAPRWKKGAFFGEKFAR